MRILAVDIGTGTQDILLFDSSVAPENCFKMVMPSPTAMFAARVRQAAAARQGIVLAGMMMGGGPVGWAVGDHLQQGLPVFATAEAARTLNDDLAQVEAMGVALVESGDVSRLGKTNVVLSLRDLDLDAIHTALRAFDIDIHYDGLAVAVLDHGNAPPDVSDRLFRFDHIRSVIEQYRDGLGQLLAFAYTPPDLPHYLTRMRSVVESAGDLNVPLVLLDTGAAASLGALEDEEVEQHDDVILLNLGNMHALATHLVGGRVAGLFEHHTGFLTTEKLDLYLQALADGSLETAAIFDDMGHGCYIVERPPMAPGAEAPFLAVTGPRRVLARASRLHPYFAVPHGDMMIAGCFGLVRACAARLPQWRDEIERGLGPARWS